MIICPNCNYQNPTAASQCEACYTPLPSLTTCANCGAGVQADASFCGQCGHSLANQTAAIPAAEPAVSSAAPPAIPEPPSPSPVPESVPDSVEVSPELVEPDPLIPPDPLPIAPPPPLPADPVPDNIPTSVDIYSELPVTEPAPLVSETAPEMVVPQTQIQSLSVRLLHVQTDTPLELPAGLDLLHIGKPNDRVPPDIDVSGFPESEIVSRIHANIRIEGDVYYIEDVGSSNGTYINNLPLAAGNRHRLRPGDRIALGKGDKVSFIFQLT
ncbi:FHA domain-containing protein [Leptolyngbya cf. ectocarpi LEGE 11479]|uniref:FHA domain-containing protein n=2 Tax=Leptolyngbya ectocarpi TaxID=1202 RepID=A0A928ZW44_LEPEC|nr:FHA domain-containing protein [Leptolyngbya cf. ectocarpi LEGE 11479]